MYVTCREARKFLDLIDSFGLTQHVAGVTHEPISDGHTLDLVSTRTAESWLVNFVIDRSIPSDHAAIHCTSVIHPPQEFSLTTARLPLCAHC